MVKEEADAMTDEERASFAMSLRQMAPHGEDDEDDFNGIMDGPEMMPIEEDR